tara:strand:- start:94 stop:348 length:255 start_codon:yes stop_codon:yes gene_type:complete
MKTKPKISHARMKMNRPLHHEEWHQQDKPWAALPQFIIMNGKHVYEKSPHKNDWTWHGVAMAYSVKSAERITRLLLRQDRGATK